MDELARPLGGDKIQRPALGPLPGGCRQGLGHLIQRVVLGQRIDGAVHVTQQHLGGGKQAWVIGQSALDEGQRFATQHLLNQGRFHVDHAVLKARLGAGLAVVHLIGVQHQRAARQAVAQGAAVVEALHPGQGAANGVGVVAVWIEPMPGKARLQALHTRGVGSGQNPVSVFHVTPVAAAARLRWPL